MSRLRQAVIFSVSLAVAVLIAPFAIIVALALWAFLPPISKLDGEG